MNLENLQLKAGEAERLLKAMASRPRLMILCELLKGERTVTALHEAVGLSMSAMSQHLARLRADELVSTRREFADDFLFARRRRRDPDARDALFDLLFAHGRSCAVRDGGVHAGSVGIRIDACGAAAPREIGSQDGRNSALLGAFTLILSTGGLHHEPSLPNSSTSPGSGTSARPL